ncbi:[protein-PII] uridylyltransferase [Xylophilus ampelinus]|uniref:Bifunctional uridylyltransferase/uridylyl-removing enzyme n=1 Tax=Xylophilus ampelinus TaxID=54067 RepID=A0A318SN62_9BURK|nr:[protein-PII] uridylyltransferase [Xylophilus ampelinus]MCS4509740.1 [protein-PII] uridylyltransferase [Xylophilus ampelinus]PYE78732.1 UTP--GlnB (protein PII) uridylyltransferase GlnD [Xylophilus ampelinus]
MSDLSALRDDYRQKKATLLDAAERSGATARGIHTVLRQLARMADQLLGTLWTRAAFPESFTLLAVGGYGRGELFPHSDIDVLLLLPDGTQPDADDALRLKIEGFIGSCWDAGLEIGSSVRTAAECLDEAARDVTVQTSLLESRRLVGDATLFHRFRKAFREALDPQAFFSAKMLELRQRHHKFEDTPYSLEPNCKESPGGLRDLQSILWVSTAAGYGENWDALAHNGLATAFEVRQIKRNEALLSLIRTRLHLIAKRREDRLVFDLQTAVAESFGYRSLAPDGTRLARRASEALMRRYYLAAKAVTQLSQILLLNIGERLNPTTHALIPINERFYEKAGMIEVASDDLYRTQPHAILETFLLYETHIGLRGLSARTLRALYNAREAMDASFRRDPVNRATFRTILQQPVGITHAIRLMNQTSVLGRYLRVFRHIVGQMQHDLFHVYTVDQHILMVLRNARRFFMAEHAHEYPFCSQLGAGWDKPWVLYTAALFHDIAKGRGGDHSELGARDVRKFCEDHDIEREDADLIAFLVQEHLTMSHIAQKSDLSDPAVISAFAQKVGDERHLTALYLLTVADIRGTSPKVWNAWKGKLLEDLYRYTLRALGGQTPNPAALTESRKREALVLLALHAEPHEAHKKLWDTLDVRYFMRHDAADIAWHARQLSRHVHGGTGQPPPLADACIVRARLSTVGEGLQVLVYTPDAPDLFARICGYFDQAGFSILDAKVHTARNGYALDTFQVVTSVLPDHYRELVSMVQTDLPHALHQSGPLPAPSRGRVSRRVRSFPVAPRVELRPDDRAQRWLLSISASDRAGLLYSIARVLARHQLNLQLAKISTLGERVEDTFLIDGPSLQRNRAQIAIETELLEVLAGP